MIKRQARLGFIVTLLLGSFLGSNAVAEEVFFPQQQTARQLLVQCASSVLTATGRERRRYCYGFVSGVEEMLRFSSQTGTTRALCIPQDTQASQLAKSYISYANSHDADLIKPAVGVVVDALYSSYACPGK